MRVYGIDYSMTSPAYSLFDGERWHIRFLTSVEKHVGCWYEFETPLGLIEVAGDRYREYSSQEDRFDKISEWMMACIDDTNARVIIEDYAMGSKGRVFNIAENCGLLKYKLFKRGIKFGTLSPSALKKFAVGKGNADKNAMHEQFIKDTGVNLMREMTPNAKDCGNPVSDVVDAFYLARWAWLNG